MLSANLDRAYVAVEPTVWTSPDEDALPPCSVRSRGFGLVCCRSTASRRTRVSRTTAPSLRPSRFGAFGGPAACEAPIRQIAFGSSHTQLGGGQLEGLCGRLVLTNDGILYSRGVAMYGSTGHGGARDVPEFSPVPALKGREVRFVAAGPFYSIAITAQGDVYSWGKAFYGETGHFTQVRGSRFTSKPPASGGVCAPFCRTGYGCGLLSLEVMCR